MKPSARLTTTRKYRNEATPSAAESPAYWAMLSGPLRFFIDT
jgi:hypothetical protein